MDAAEGKDKEHTDEDEFHWRNAMLIVDYSVLQVFIPRNVSEVIEDGVDTFLECERRLVEGTEPLLEFVWGGFPALGWVSITAVNHVGDILEGPLASPIPHDEFGQVVVVVANVLCQENFNPSGSP